MSKWKCEICGNDFDNFHAQGFDNKIYCPLCYFKKLSADLQVENEKLKKQQQEFINYLEKEIVDCKAGSGQQYYAQEHLKMFKEIIGVKDGQ